MLLTVLHVCLCMFNKLVVSEGSFQFRSFGIHPNAQKENGAYLFFFASLHLLGFEQEHLKTEQFRDQMKLLTTVKSSAVRSHTCSLFFRSFSISSFFFFLQPSCNQREKAPPSKPELFKDVC